MKCVVLIPIYKDVLSTDEKASLCQCFHVLKKYDKIFCCPKSLDITEYENLVGCSIQTFRCEDSYFMGIESYNKLMMSPFVYNAFACYDYMLIYQLDAWVFSDKLEEWCNKGYDYIGAPWFGEWKTHEDGEEMTDCGNGGLSLRRIKKFIEVTNPDTRLMTRGEIIRIYFSSFKTWDKGIERLLGFKNTIGWHLKKKKHLWEDAFFCRGLDGLKIQLNRPNALEAATFSFEKSPSYLFSLTKQLPFGCHAWRKYEYETFWSKYITIV